ncbi:Transmembrane protein 93 [Cynara cardunculus var. scolymus]|uniref:ER membrane protein complex subunit 6 n=1 Tax=Cynara cardunculus var. scolymus TaxID=59895 RepID=A0A103XT60_CYNCS|nr:Transmembrane protein 93 [Cynara cardunculus var. scolymus]
MAGHDDSGASGKKSSENEVPTFNVENMQSNMKVVYYSRTFMSIIGGVIAGILGFTGLMGFVVYVLVMAITSVCLTAKAGLLTISCISSKREASWVSAAFRKKLDKEAVM